MGMMWIGTIWMGLCGLGWGLRYGSGGGLDVGAVGMDYGSRFGLHTPSGVRPGNSGEGAVGTMFECRSNTNTTSRPRLKADRRIEVEVVGVR